MDKRSSKTILKIYRGFSACLASEPFSKVNVRDIIKAAGISPTGFYAHFKAKNDVLQGLLAKLFLTVKIRGDLDLENHLALLFFRAKNDLELWQGIVALEENATYLYLSLLPWCKSFLMQGKSKTGSKLASELLSSALLEFMQNPEENCPEKMAHMLKEPLSLLLAA